MQRSTFLLICSGITVLFGGSMLFAPSIAADGYALAPTPELIMMFRAVGAAVLAIGVVNFLVRNEPDSTALRSVLVLNALYHTLAIINVGVSIAAGAVLIGAAVPGLSAHLFIGAGSGLFAARLKDGPRLIPGTSAA